MEEDVEIVDLVQDHKAIIAKSIKKDIEVEAIVAIEIAVTNATEKVRNYLQRKERPFS